MLLLECVRTFFLVLTRQQDRSRLSSVGAWVLALRYVVIALTQQASWDRVPSCSNHLFLLGFYSQKKGQQCLGSDKARLVVAWRQGPRLPIHPCLVEHSPYPVLTAGLLPSESLGENLRSAAFLGIRAHTEPKLNHVVKILYLMTYLV